MKKQRRAPSATAASSAVRRIAQNHSRFPEGTQCCICLEQIIKRGLAKECPLHYYCYECITTWARRMSPQCPICKKCITKIKMCETPDQCVNVDWEKERVVRVTKRSFTFMTDLQQTMWRALVEQQQDADDETFEIEEDESSESLHNAVREGDDGQLFLSDGDDDYCDYSDEQEPGRRTPHSFWDDNLSRGPVFYDERNRNNSSSSSRLVPENLDESGIDMSAILNTKRQRRQPERLSPDIKDNNNDNNSSKKKRKK